MLRSVSYSAAREAVWEDEIGSMQRLDIKPDAYSEPHSTAMEDVQDDVEVELEVKRARGGLDGQQQTTSLILHLKRRWIRPSEHSSLLSNYYHFRSRPIPPPLPHPLVSTYDRAVVRCACWSDGEWEGERLLHSIDAPVPPEDRVVRVPHADLSLYRSAEQYETYTSDGGDAFTLVAHIHSLDSKRRYRTYTVTFAPLTLDDQDDNPIIEDVWLNTPMRITLTHTGSRRTVEAHVTSALHTTTYKRLTVQVHAQRVPFAPNFSAIHIQLRAPHSPHLTLTLTPTLIPGVEYSGVTGQLSVGEKHWSEQGEAVYDAGEASEDDEEDETRRVVEFEQQVEVKRWKVAERKAELDDAARRDRMARKEARHKRRAVAASAIAEEESQRMRAEYPKVTDQPTIKPAAAVQPRPAPVHPRHLGSTSSTLAFSIPPPVAAVATSAPPLPRPRPRPSAPLMAPPIPAVPLAMKRTTPAAASSSAPRQDRISAALAPVSLSRWGSVSSGATTSEDSDAAAGEEVADVKRNQQSHLAGPSAAAPSQRRSEPAARRTQQPASATSASSSIKLPQS